MREPCRDLRHEPRCRGAIPRADLTRHGNAGNLARRSQRQSRAVRRIGRGNKHESGQDGPGGCAQLRRILIPFDLASCRRRLNGEAQGHDLKIGAGEARNRGCDHDQNVPIVVERAGCTGRPSAQGDRRTGIVREDDGTGGSSCSHLRSHERETVVVVPHHEPACGDAHGGTRQNPNLDLPARHEGAALRQGQRCIRNGGTRRRDCEETGDPERCTSTACRDLLG